MSFEDWLKHIEYQVSTAGQWVGLLDEECRPLCELPAWLSFTAPKTRLDVASVEARFPVQPGDRVLDELAADGLGEQDSEGRLVPNDGPERFLAVIRPGERRVFFITHAVVDAGMSALKIQGSDLLEGLSFWPCPSTPHEWVESEFSDWSTDAAGGEYEKARRLARVKFGLRADGHTVDGPAVEVIRTVVQDSLDAVNDLMGWSDDAHMVVDFAAGEPGPKVLVRTADDFVWDTISKPALDSGVSVTVTLWWPGDAPVRVRTSRDPDQFENKTWDRPMQVVRVEMKAGE